MQVEVGDQGSQAVGVPIVQTNGQLKPGPNNRTALRYVALNDERVYEAHLFLIKLCRKGP